MHVVRRVTAADVYYCKGEDVQFTTTISFVREFVSVFVYPPAAMCPAVRPWHM
jgi:hypothetical protein